MPISLSELGLILISYLYMYSGRENFCCLTLIADRSLSTHASFGLKLNRISKTLTLTWFRYEEWFPTLLQESGTVITWCFQEVFCAQSFEVRSQKAALQTERKPNKLSSLSRQLALEWRNSPKMVKMPVSSSILVKHSQLCVQWI